MVAAFSALLVGYGFALLVHVLWVRGDPPAVAAGFNAFALMFVMALAIERLIQPFVPILGPDTTVAKANLTKVQATVAVGAQNGTPVVRAVRAVVLHRHQRDRVHRRLPHVRDRPTVATRLGEVHRAHRRRRPVDRRTAGRDAVHVVETVAGPVASAPAVTTAATTVTSRATTVLHIIDHAPVLLVVPASNSDAGATSAANRVLRRPWRGRARSEATSFLSGWIRPTRSGSPPPPA
ncbi:MAG TPA: hypothetical protein VFX16_23145 [Pseudonocardiaceae bacterium]|nr:hypothetical protein [Pseudonocardiaceae bacterium]